MSAAKKRRATLWDATLISRAQDILASGAVPEDVAILLRDILDALTHLDPTRSRERLRELRRALGIVPSSEKIAPSTSPTPRDPRRELTNDLAKHNLLADRFVRAARRHRMEAKRLTVRIDSLPPEDHLPPLTPEDEAESDRETAEHLARAALGDGPDPAFRSHSEAFMRGAETSIVQVEGTATIDPEALSAHGAKVGEAFWDERVRYSISFAVEEITIDVEKRAIRLPDGTSEIITASTDHIGPPRMRVTWDFLVSLAVMVTQYAMPLNRFAGLITTSAKKFTSAEMSRYYHYTAERMLPIYLELVRQLANTRIMGGDDTDSRVLEVNRYRRDLERGRAASQPPWADYATSELARITQRGDEGTGKLGPPLAALLGFVSESRKDGSDKIALHTSIAWGRSIESMPESMIVLFRSHIGSFGNLLETLLWLRHEDQREITVVSDLLTANLVADPRLKARFAVTQAGCTSHARRPFARHRDESPGLCDAVLHFFHGLYFYEKSIDLYGRNRTNTLAVRGTDSKRLWEDIKDICVTLEKQWSRETKLGGAARYVLRHEKELTHYLSDPRVPLTNDSSERGLRCEALIEGSAHFRQSLEGRFALDINRTVLQTAVASGAPVADYVRHVLKADPTDVSANPEKYTPLAYRNSLALT